MVGRPTTYKDAYPNEVIEHLAQGFTLASWAGTVGVHRDTVYEWASKHQAFSDAIKIGRSKGQHVWEKRLTNQAEKGEGNTAAIIFAMKNLYRDDWADRIVNEHTGADGGPIKTEDMSMKEVARRMAFLFAAGKKEMEEDDDSK